MKYTSLSDIHEKHGAKMVEFAGYYMPVSYEGIREEHTAVRRQVGLFDVSHMGEFIVKGRQALQLLQKVTTNDVARLEIGQAQYSCLPNEEGGIVDDLLIYRLSEDQCAAGEMAFMLVVNASNIEKDWTWINQHNDFDTRLINISERTGLLALQGPKATETLKPLTDIDLENLKYYTFTKGQVAGIDNVLVSATGYTGSGGFELYGDTHEMKNLWEALLESGKEHGIQPAGLGARDTLRLEMGYCLYGNDINDDTSPIEAGLGWITKIDKGDFIGRDIFARQKEEGVKRKLVGFEVDGRRVPRIGYTIEDMEGHAIGQVTSGTQSPSLGIPIGMGYVARAYSKKDTPIQIVAGKRKMEARVTKMPFYT
ncbi:MAG: glycine cleavage system aminomethyltransferase GcvT [Saprospiraceae bacterium]|nr:glycine cleavage system aminomethyltransferase GcvT [Saprospiraceae bacterium]